jgi:hypothetical protein
MPQNPNDLSDDELLTIRDEDMALIGKLTPTERQRRLVLFDAQTRGAGQPEGSATSRFFGGAAKMLNPITAVKGVAGAVAHPIDTASNLLQAQLAQLIKARDDLHAGRYSEAVGHGTAGVLPLIGPAAAGAGERMASGDIAGGLGEGAGLLAPFAAGEAMRMRAAARAKSSAPAVLEQQAAQQVADRVLAPGNPAFRGRANAIAPNILTRGLKGGREELRQAADSGMMDAGARIVAAYGAAGGPQAPVAIDEIIQQLRQAIDDQSMHGQPIVGAEGRIAALDERIAQLQTVATPTPKVGMTIPFEDLRKFRDEQYRLADQARGFERMGNPIKSDAGYAAREAGSAVRQQFAKHSPEAAAANADYSFFKTLGDVLDPAIGRPKLTAPTEGVTGGARTTGAVAGMMVGPKAAFVMSVVLPWVRKLKSEPGWLLADAQDKIRLAAAIRAGNIPRAQTLMLKIGEMMPKGGGGAALPMAAEDQSSPAPTRARQ